MSGRMRSEPGDDEFVQPASGLLDGAVGGLELDQGRGVSHRQVRPRHQVTQLPLHPLLVGGGQAGVQPDGEQLTPVDRAGVGQAGRLPGLERLPGDLGRQAQSHR